MNNAASSAVAVPVAAHSPYVAVEETHRKCLASTTTRAAGQPHTLQCMAKHHENQDEQQHDALLLRQNLRQNSEYDCSAYIQ
jgi:hypothetical protein